MKQDVQGKQKHQHQGAHSSQSIFTQLRNFVLSHWCRLQAGEEYIGRGPRFVAVVYLAFLTANEGPVLGIQ
jgi:hypothetical protein